MNNPTTDSTYRTISGQLFSALTSQFGVHYFNEIEDAIQNSFLKSIKNWNPNNTPEKKKDWLYITARNDLINQLRRNRKTVELVNKPIEDSSEPITSDLRLETLFLVASSAKISKQAKIIFVLKNIFGLNIREISENTLLGNDAIYKTLIRAKKMLQSEFKNQEISTIVKSIGEKEILIVEEVLYAVFNSGFDSFNEKQKSIINKDLCLEALSVAKILFEEHRLLSTSNLLSLFCFHLARTPAKVDKGKLISFFNQNRDLWKKELINLGFHYLKKPEKISKIYMEALIVSRYMSTNDFSTGFWEDIIKLYKILLQLSPSPIITLNYCFCLYKAQRREEAMNLLENIELQLPKDHVYLSLLKSQLLKEISPKQTQNIATEVFAKLSQSIRRDFLIENEIINL